MVYYIIKILKFVLSLIYILIIKLRLWNISLNIKHTSTYYYFSTV